MTEEHPVAVEPVLAFDCFRTLPRQRRLLEAGRPVRIGSRAFDVLLALLAMPGERIGKAELLGRVWPNTHVVEGNLKFQVAALRRVLRDGHDGRRFIETSQGQGYCFVAPVVVTEESQASEPLAGTGRRHNLPEQLTPLVGRDDVVAKLTEQLAVRRLLTVVGPGGIGKTSVALAVAERVIGAFEDGIWVVDLARIADPGRVRGAVAAAVGLAAGPTLTTQALAAAMRGRRMLLVLDNCMHVIDAAAGLVSAVLRGAPYVRILATSREPLRTEGEHLWRLAPLETPPWSREIEAADALCYPSVQLFVQQATANQDGFQLTDVDAPVIADICRKLDGIPLALELAAARVGVLGLGGLAAQLDDKLRVLTGGRRTALPRHRTLRATLDWSYDLLSPSERIVFRRLAVFTGGLTLAAAASVASGDDVPEDETAQVVLELAAKSLLVADLDSPDVRFRLLDTTRAYALEKARDEDELASLARRHAKYFLNLLETASRQRADGDTTHAAIERDIDNLRAALEWAFSPAGDPTIAVTLTADSMPVWLSMSLLGEALAWIEKAIPALADAGLRGSRQEMALQTGLGISFQIATGGTSEAGAALSRALALGEQLRDTDYQLHVLHTLWVHHTRIGEVRSALNFARRAHAIASSMCDPDGLATAEWMLGILMHFAGQHGLARRQLERLLLGSLAGSRTRQIRRAGFDQITTVHYVLGHVLWVQGYPDQAAEAVRISMEQARRTAHPVTLCSALAWGAFAFALRTGDLDAADRSATELVCLAEKHALVDHLSFGRAALAITSLRKAGSKAGIEQARTALLRWRESQWHVVLGVSDFAQAAAAAGLVDEVSVIVDEALQRAKPNLDLWAYPETLRVKGELLLMQDVPDPRGARRYFVRALEKARAQGAPAWQLRAAASLTRLGCRTGDGSASIGAQTGADEGVLPHFRRVGDPGGT